MMNKVAWLGIGVMVATVLLYLGDLITDFARPALGWIAAVGGVLFIGGLAFARIRSRAEIDAQIPEEQTDSRRAA